MSQPRSLVAFCPDWAVIVSGRSPSAEVVVVHANRVVATSPAARASGVRAGMRRREAQGICPDLEVIARDVAAEARSWEPAVAAVEAFAPGVEVLGPGQLALGSRGPSRYFGGDGALAARVAAAVEEVVATAGGVAGTASVTSTAAGVLRDWAGCCQVGIADGLFAAGLAARLAPVGQPLVVGRGGSGEFLAPVPLKVLVDAASGTVPKRQGPAVSTAGTGLPGTGGTDFAALVDLLGRLGLKTLGDFAALPAPAVLGRFGAEGMLAHRLARGLGERTVQGRLPPPDWVVATELDPPAEQMQAAVFVGRALAEQLHDRLLGAGLVCTRLAIEAETEYGTTLRRSWRHDGALSAAAIGERVRWQLEGWAQTGQAAGQSGPIAALAVPGSSQGVEAAQAGRITRLALVPEEVRPDDGRQLGFWGNDAGTAARAARALARVQGLLGPDAALTAVLQGGRDYSEQVLFVPWGEPRVPLRAGGQDDGQGGQNQIGQSDISQSEIGQSPEGGQGPRSRQGGRARAAGQPGPARNAGSAHPAGQARSLGRGRAGAQAKDKPPPWPGRLPGLAPAIVHRSPRSAQVLDADGAPVSVGSRGVMSARPAWVVIGNGPRWAVGDWAGPWPLEERWWEAGGRRRARVQVCTADGNCYLLAREKRRWWVEATYD